MVRTSGRAGSEKGDHIEILSTYLFQLIECLSREHPEQISQTPLTRACLSGDTYFYTARMLELVRMNQQRLFPVLLLDLVLGRIDAQIENVIRARWCRERVHISLNTELACCITISLQLERFEYSFHLDTDSGSNEMMIDVAGNSKYSPRAP